MFKIIAHHTRYQHSITQHDTVLAVVMKVGLIILLTDYIKQLEGDHSNRLIVTLTSYSHSNNSGASWQIGGRPFYNCTYKLQAKRLGAKDSLLKATENTVMVLLTFYKQSK